MAIVYPHYGHREALKALAQKQRASLVAANQISQLRKDVYAQIAQMMKLSEDEVKMWNMQHEEPIYKKLHSIGRVSVYRIEKNYLAKFAAHLKLNGELKEVIGATAKIALRGLRKYFPKTYKRQGEIVAYRCWKIVNGFLTPVTTSGGAGIVFTGPILEAGTVPTMDNQAGLYAVSKNNIDWLRGEYEHHAWGEVGCYGRVIEHERGYRSQHQVIRSITLAPGTYPDWYLKGIESTYQCEVTVGKPQPDKYAELMDFYNAYSQTMFKKMPYLQTALTPPPPPQPPKLSPLAQQIMQPGSVLSINQSMYNELRKMGLVR